MASRGAGCRGPASRHAAPRSPLGPMAMRVVARGARAAVDAGRARESHEPLQPASDRAGAVGHGRPRRSGRGATRRRVAGTGFRSTVRRGYSADGAGARQGAALAGSVSTRPAGDEVSVVHHGDHLDACCFRLGSGAPHLDRAHRCAGPSPPLASRPLRSSPEREPAAGL